MPRKKKEEVTKPVIKEKLPDLYRLDVWQDGVMYGVSDESIQNLFPKIKEHMPQIKTRVTVVLRHGEKRVEQQVLAWPFKRILNNRLGQEILLKRLLMKLNS